MSLSQPLISNAPARYLVLVPILVISVSAVLLSRVLPAVVESCSNACSTVTSPLLHIGCFFSAFFQQCLATPTSSAFIMSFLAFVTALLTISHVEASRQFNQPSSILTQPTWIWIAVNAVTGAMVTPVILCANINHHKDGAVVQRNDPRACSESEVDTPPRTELSESEIRPLISHHDADTSTTTSASRIHDRHLFSLQRTYAIPIAIFVGFVLPSAMLIICPTPVVSGLWNFFPFTIFAVHALALRLLGGDGRSSFHAERNVASVARIYAIPVALSILAHVYLVACWIWAKAGVQDQWGPASKLMLINFWAIVTTYFYWLFY